MSFIFVVCALLAALPSPIHSHETTPKPEQNLAAAIPEEIIVAFLDRLIQQGQMEITKGAIEQQINFFKQVQPDYAKEMEKHPIDKLAYHTVMRQRAQSAYRPPTGNKFLDMLQRNGVPIIANITGIEAALNPEKRKEQQKKQIEKGAQKMIYSVLKRVLGQVYPPLFQSEIDPPEGTERVHIPKPIPPGRVPRGHNQQAELAHLLQQHRQLQAQEQHLGLPPGPHGGLPVAQQYQHLNLPHQGLRIGTSQDSTPGHSFLRTENRPIQTRPSSIRRRTSPFGGGPTLFDQLRNRQGVPLSSGVGINLPNLRATPPPYYHTTASPHTLFSATPAPTSAGAPLASEIASSLAQRGVYMSPEEVQAYLDRLTLQSQQAQAQLSARVRPELPLVTKPETPTNVASGILPNGQTWQSLVHRPIARPRPNIRRDNVPPDSRSTSREREVIERATQSRERERESNETPLSQFRNRSPFEAAIQTMSSSPKQHSARSRSSSSDRAPFSTVSYPNPVTVRRVDGASAEAHSVAARRLNSLRQVHTNKRPRSRSRARSRARTRSPSDTTRRTTESPVMRETLERRQFARPRLMQTRRSVAPRYQPLPEAPFTSASASASAERFQNYIRPDFVPPISSRSTPLPMNQIMQQKHTRLRFTTDNDDGNDNLGGRLSIPSVFPGSSLFDGGLGGRTRARQQNVIDLKLPNQWDQGARTLGSRVYTRRTSLDASDGNIDSPFMGWALG